MSNYRKDLETNRYSPILEGNSYFEYLPQNVGLEELIYEGSNLFIGFRYRELRKYKASLQKLKNKTVINALMKQACYLKVHASVHGTYDLCKYIMKKVRTLEEQRTFLDQVEDLVHYVDLAEEDYWKSYQFKRAIPWYSLIETLEGFEYKLPSMNGLIPWEVKIGVDKESKMPLCMKPAPSKELVEEFECELDRLFDNLELPYHLEIPTEEELVEPTSNKVYSRGQIVEDREDPIHRHGRFLYQQFMTGFDTPREVWLPSPEYKNLSKFWYVFLEKFLKECFPMCCSSLDEESILQIIAERWTQCATLDIRGFGLAFPREYIVSVLNKIRTLYPQTGEYCDRTIGVLDDIQVEYEGTIVSPIRGVGLGYFHPLMYIVIFALMQDYWVVASFADDTLIKDEDYESCVQKLTHFEIEVNYKKSGITWKYVTMFMGAMLDPERGVIVHLTNENAELSGVFKQRFHWERKMIVANMLPDEQPVIAYHLERIFGREFFRGESQSNFLDGGYLNCIPQDAGCSRGKYACDITPHINRPGFYPELFLTRLNRDEKKKIHNVRKTRWRTRRRLERSEYEFSKQENTEKRYVHDAPLRYSEWGERALLAIEMTSGHTTFNLGYFEIQEALSAYAWASDPIQSYLNQEDTDLRYPTVLDDETRGKLLSATRYKILEKNYAFLEDSSESDNSCAGSIKSIEGITPLDAYLEKDLKSSLLEIEQVTISAADDVSAEGEVDSEELSCILNLYEDMDDESLASQEEWLEDEMN